MRIYNRYVISLAIAFGVINTIMAALRQNDLTVYFTVNLIAYMIISLVYVNLNPRARKLLNSTWVVLFSGFMCIVILKVIDIVGK